MAKKKVKEIAKAEPKASQAYFNAATLEVTDKLNKYIISVDKRVDRIVAALSTAMPIKKDY